MSPRGFMAATSCVMACLSLGTGCTQSFGFAVALTITADQSSVSESALEHVTQLVYVASGGEDGMYSSSIKPPLPRTEEVLYRPALTTRALQLNVAALDVEGHDVAVGASAELTLTPGHTTFAQIILRGPDASDMDMAVRVDAADAPPANEDLSGTDGASIPPGPDPCRADTPLSADAVFASSKHVIALYDTRFPISIDNLTPSNDYYEKSWLTPSGMSGAWMAEGGLLRTRPLGVAPTANEGTVNLEREIKVAIAAGIGAFAVLVEGSDMANIGKVSKLMAAAVAVDSRFKIIPLIDTLNTGAFTNGANIATAIEMIAADTNALNSLYYVDTSLILVLGYEADKGGGVSTWTTALTDAQSAETAVAFVPLLSTATNASEFAAVKQLYGFGLANAPTPAAALALQSAITTSHTTYPGKPFFSPVQPQTYDPSAYTYDEGQNSTAFRDSWNSAIEGGADWVFINSWNSFLPSTQVEPYTDATLDTALGSAFYDLTGFYAHWYLSRAMPSITHDVLYWFHRREATTAPAAMEGQAMTLATGSTASNGIELVALMTDAATLSITIAGNTSTSSPPAGVGVFSIPLVTGTPAFSLSRDGKTIVSGTSDIQIVSSLSSGYLDLTYYGESAASDGSCMLALP